MLSRLNGAEKGDSQRARPDQGTRTAQIHEPIHGSSVTRCLSNANFSTDMAMENPTIWTNLWSLNHLASAELSVGLTLPIYLS